MVITDGSFRCTVEKTNGAEINENKKVVSDSSLVLKQAGIFKEFITITEKDHAMEWKLIKVP